MRAQRYVYILKNSNSVSCNCRKYLTTCSEGPEINMSTAVLPPCRSCWRLLHRIASPYRRQRCIWCFAVFRTHTEGSLFRLCRDPGWSGFPMPRHCAMWSLPCLTLPCSGTCNWWRVKILQPCRTRLPKPVRSRHSLSTRFCSTVP